MVPLLWIDDLQRKGQTSTFTLLSRLLQPDTRVGRESNGTNTPSLPLTFSQPNTPSPLSLFSSPSPPVLPFLPIYPLSLSPLPLPLSFPFSLYIPSPFLLSLSPCPSLSPYISPLPLPLSLPFSLSPLPLSSPSPPVPPFLPIPPHLTRCPPPLTVVRCERGGGERRTGRETRGA